MRYILKGGVWKNTEDEILKAAVMKYGLNQWARISSLLVRKSAAQCKARWYEWLDPSIKKTEWTREEEEKLLHLAKMFPCQWRTIAPVIGRTPASCIQQYEKLLDKAQGREPDQNDPRKLRLGEIDPNPETKPARPDEIDMDDDEKEMLQEARARLANIRGKKAKRKAREKQLESARRLSTLQKRREMKAAGIQIFIKQRMIGLDYNAEIPFQRVEPAGRFKPSKEENPTVDKDRVNIAMQQIESSHRASREKALREKDLKKFNLLKEKNFPAAAEKLKKIRDSQALAEAGPRTELILPEAQIQQKEFSEIQKMSAEAAGSSATEALAGNFSIRRSEQWSVNRTPAPPSTLMQEARNALAYTNAPTPLLAGIDENANVEAFQTEEVKEQVSHSELKTPNPLLQSVKTAKEEGLFKAPLPVKRAQGSGQQADLLNQDIDDAWDDLEKEEQNKEESSFTFENVKAQLSALPAPSNEFEVDTSKLDQQENKIQELVDSELLGREEAISIDEIITSTLSEQKGLPMPQNQLFTAFRPQEDFTPQEEKLADRIKEIQKVDISNLEAQQDIEGMIWKMMHSEDKDPITQSKFTEAQQLVEAELESSHESYLPTSLNISGRELLTKEKQSFAEQVEALSSAFEISTRANKRLLKKIDALEKKNNTQLGPYYQKDLSIRQKLNKELKAQQKLKSQKQIYELLERVEEKSGERRMNELQKYLNSLEEKEVGLQERYLKLRELLE